MSNKKLTTQLQVRQLKKRVTVLNQRTLHNTGTAEATRSIDESVLNDGTRP